MPNFCTKNKKKIKILIRKTEDEEEHKCSDNIIIILIKRTEIEKESGANGTYTHKILNKPQRMMMLMMKTKRKVPLRVEHT